MLNKPIIVVPLDGPKSIPPKLAMVADGIINADVSTPEGQKQLMDELRKLGLMPKQD